MCTEGSVGRGTGEAQNVDKKEAAPSRPYPTSRRVGFILVGLSSEERDLIRTLERWLLLFGEERIGRQTDLNCAVKSRHGVWRACSGPDSESGEE